MANYSTTVTGSDRFKKNAAVRATPKPLPVPKSPVFTAALDALAAHLDGNSITSLSKSRITALGKKIGLKETDLGTLVAVHKLAPKTNLPADALFALSKDGVRPDVTSLASNQLSDNFFSKPVAPDRIGKEISEKLIYSGTIAMWLALPAVSRAINGLSNELVVIYYITIVLIATVTGLSWFSKASAPR